MAAGSFKITQARPTVPSVGTAGASRNDLWLNRQCTLEDAGNPAGTRYLWELLDRPAGSAAAFTPSAGPTIDADTGRATLDSSTSATPLITPDMTARTWRVRCTLLDPRGRPVASRVQLLACTYDNAGTLAKFGARAGVRRRAPRVELERRRARLRARRRAALRPRHGRRRRPDGAHGTGRAYGARGGDRSDGGNRPDGLHGADGSDGARRRDRPDGHRPRAGGRHHHGQHDGRRARRPTHLHGAREPHGQQPLRALDDARAHRNRDGGRRDGEPLDRHEPGRL